MATSIGTAWIQIKPSLSGVSNDIKKALGDSGSAASVDFGNKFKSSFLVAAKTSFTEAFSEFGKRSDAAFAQFRTAAAVGIAVVTGGIIAFAKQLDSASGSQKSFIANMELAGSSTEDTAKTFKLLQDYANKSIYSLTDMTSTAGILASTGVKNAGELVRAFGNMASAADDPAQAIKSISQQMAQVNGKGFVQTMDFRIMQEQASGPMKQVQDELMKLNHWSPAEFQNALSNGMISAEMLDKAILVVGNNPILDQLATKPRTISDAWEALTSTVVSNFATSKTWADVQQKLIDKLMQASDWVSKNQDEIERWITQVINAASSVAKWVADNKDLILTALKVFAAFKALQIGTGAVRSAMDTLSPYGKILKGAFQLAVGGAQTLIGKFKGISDASGGISKTSGEIDNLGNANKNLPKTFTFGDSIASFFQNIGKVASGVVDSIMTPLKTLLKGVGDAIAGFFTALASPEVLVGAIVFAVAAGAVALAIWAIGSAIGAVAPGLGDFLNVVLIPLGLFLLGVLVVALGAITDAITKLTTNAVIPLVNAVSGGLTNAFNAIGGVISTAGGAISGVISSIANGISNVINSIANLLKSVGGQDWYGTGYGVTRNFSAGLIDGLIDLLQDSLNKIINNLLNVPGVGQALKSIGLKDNPVNISGFKLGRRATGGAVFGQGSGTSDSIPMALSNGEYVIKAAVAQKIGYSNLDNLNSSGEMGGNFSMGDIIINGYNKDPKELADEISKEIALRRKRVMA